MEMSYICRNTVCSYPGKHRFEMTFDGQAVMDDKNMATVFCPFCKQEMVPVLPEQPLPENRIDSGLS